MTDFSFVSTHVATGAAINDATDVGQLVQAGVTHVLDLRDDFDDAPLLATHPLLTYSWNGTPDDGQPKPPEWFAKSLAFALPALCAVPVIALPTLARPKVYAHCSAGVNRGPSTAFAILCALDWAPVMAETQIRDVRPQVGLAYKADALAALASLGYL